MLGVGASTYKSKGSEKERKKQVLRGAILSIFIALLVWWYFKYYKNCGECA
jgi:ABC-type proline/glycine betaine transport system permease subunit